MTIEKLRFPIWTTMQSNNAATFIDNWAKLYNYPNYERYEELLHLLVWKYDDLLELFTWKNGMQMSGKKRLAFEKHIAAHITTINRLKIQFDSEEFNELFLLLPAIWKIFLLHIINPGYPIFDQHVYRAMIYIRQQNVLELPYSQDQRMRIYRNEYLSFFCDLKASCGDCSEKVIDNALWAFGKFLKEYSMFFEKY